MQPVSIELFLHMDGSGGMKHTARTEHNAVIAPGTLAARLQGLVPPSDLIRKSLTNDAQPTQQEIVQFGKQLADIIFAGSVNSVYSGASAAATASGEVHVSLCAEDASLKSIPWEFLLWPGVGQAPHRRRALSRIVPVSDGTPLAPAPLNQELRVLLAVAEDPNRPAIDWVETRRRMQEVFDEHMKQAPAAIKMQIEPAATIVGLTQAVTAFSPHIVQFIGHGSPNGLIFMKPNGKANPVSSTSFFNAVSGGDVRLVVLSACDTASNAGAVAAIAPIAEALVSAGLPAVIGHQMPISVRSIAPFSVGLYQSLLKTGNIDTAVNFGRTMIGIALDNSNIAAVEWGIPVLYRKPGCSILFVP